MNTMSKTGAVLVIGTILAIAVPHVWAYGESAGLPGSTTLPPVCTTAAPKVVWPFNAKAVGKNTVRLSWGAVDSATSWTVAYGSTSKKYVYGLSNFGNSDSRSVDISSLPGGTYYFSVRANSGCMPGPFSPEVAVRLGGGGVGLTPSVPLVTGGLNVGTKNVVPKVTTSPKNVQPTVSARPGVPTPTVTRPSLWQSILRLFGVK